MNEAIQQALIELAQRREQINQAIAMLEDLEAAMPQNNHEQPPAPREGTKPPAAGPVEKRQRRQVSSCSRRCPPSSGI